MDVLKVEIRDLRTMFHSTMVLYDDSPVVILDIDNTRRAKLFNIGTAEYGVKELKDKKFCFNKIRLGYVNEGGLAVFTKRTTARIYQQGVSKESVRGSCAASEVNRVPRGLSDHCKTRVFGFSSNGWCNTVRNIYPSLEEAISILQEDDYAVSIAFDRQFSVDKRMNLYYRDTVVGGVRDSKPVLFDEFSLLKGAL